MYQKRTLPRVSFCVVVSFALMAALFLPVEAWATVDDQKQTASEEEIAQAMITGEIKTELDDSPDGFNSDEASTFSTADKRIKSLYGTTQYDTAAKEALHAFSSASTVIIASGQSYVDALSATSLAGAIGCPILLTEAGSLPGATASALGSLKPSSIIIVGGAAVVSEAVSRSLASYGAVTRLYGASQYDTQLKIYEYGKQRSLWDSQGRVILASGSTIAGRFADALSVSPVAYRLKAPVFLVDDNGSLPDASKTTLMNNSFNQAIIAGGTVVVSSITAGFMEAVTLKNGGQRNVLRSFGTTQYETSFEIAKWAVSANILKWDNAAFATSISSYDALAGSVVQGKEGSVLLIAGQGDTSAATALRNAGGSVKGIKFFGGTAVITLSERVRICSVLEIGYLKIDYADTGIGLSPFAQIEALASKSVDLNYSEQDIVASANPENFPAGTAEFYQFAVLSDGYSGMTAAQLDAFIAARVGYQESEYGVTSKLRGTGVYFVAAAKMYNINEVYLVSHAAVESAWGCSTLAQGKVKGYEGYLNFYGIGAYDLDRYNGGAALAKSKGWTTPEKAIMGAAQWISNNYIHPTVPSAAVSGDQNTLWRMKWDVRRAAFDGTVWHQYATGRTLATGVA
ncbi:MAG: cell wall-binding repeat-containing protein, partial [Raoultibacter sp.]